MTLVARARDADHARALYGLGVTDAVPETDRGEPAALRGGAGRSRRADGSRHRLDPREAGRVSARSWPRPARPSGRARYARRDERERLQALLRERQRSPTEGPRIDRAPSQRALWLPRRENPASEVAAGPSQVERAAHLTVERGRIGRAALKERAGESRAPPANVAGQRAIRT